MACRARALGVCTWIMMAAAFQPTLRRYGGSPLWGFALPAIGLFYICRRSHQPFDTTLAQAAAGKNESMSKTCIDEPSIYCLFTST